MNKCIRLKETSLVGAIFLLCCFGVMGISGCGSSISNSVVDSSSDVTTLSYSISPSKNTYIPGETVVISVTTTGPLDVGASFSFSLSGGSLTSFPVATSKNYTFTAGSSGSTIKVKGRPSSTKTVNGVEMIVGESPTYSIRAL